ncbi:MAG TPA: hypothetical protein VG710_09390 [Opitutus sp.]|nr:hypothetical protein [Opitutus sp.]
MPKSLRAATKPKTSFHAFVSRHPSAPRHSPDAARPHLCHIMYDN